ncbi:ABC transporter substrate-binding protein [uncultured Paraglaciecola sp.]|jgi:putative thiamine transport system substrate-binding protein|uniref:ABC transporter substrate-binding protein n=1 Tax=uncultured Paraglaciecola sp. TaxID=1765024 RepID=UPI0025E67021|nr:ABC transporter substrate-binding protein [uncultured Paraglaciecola sp.]
MTSLLFKGMVSSFVVCWLLLSATTASANPQLKPVTTVQESSAQWQQTLNAAKGQTVYFYAWGGSKPVNDYLRWATREIAQQYGIRLMHVKVTDPSEPVSRLTAENGRTSAIDLMWVNGENFAYLKQQGFLLGNLWSAIPNAAFLAVEHLPITVDFGEPMDGFEVPWGIGQFNLIAESQVYPQAKISAQSLLNISQANANTVTYPRPPEFHGTTFLKQLLVDLSKADPRLYQLATLPAQEALLPLLWQYLDRLHPHLWQQGKAFPSSAAEQLLLYQQKRLSMAVSFNPNQWVKEKSSQQISESSLRRYFSDGAITNSHNLAIPKSAPSPNAAKVVINFMLSEKAQQEKFTGVWGDPSVIRSLLNDKATMPAHPELHSSWHVLIEKTWQQRYGG